jgi:adenine-specific DNA-methyltransferase
MPLTVEEKAEIKSYIDRGEPLPPKYRYALFAEPHEAELIWPGKSHETTSVVLPFQSIEQIDEPRAESAAQADLFQMDRATGRQTGGWTNKLIWGDNKLVLSSLKNGPLRREIENAGGLKLVYIDPPFDVGTDFSFDIEVGGEAVTKEPSVIEDIAYRDTWGRGADSYIDMLYQRFRLLHELMSSDASLYVHCDGRVNSYVRLALDEIFGKDQIANEITWKRTGARSGSRQYNIITDRILYYKKGNPTFITQYTPYTREYLDQYFEKDEEGRFFQSVTLTAPERRTGSSGLPWRGENPTAKGRHWAIPGFIRPKLSNPKTENVQAALDDLDTMGRILWPKKAGGVPRFKQFSDDFEGVELQDIWTDISPLSANSLERVGYETQKPERLLDRVLTASSNVGDLVSDFFCGSGTTLAVAEKLGRKWIGCDLGRFAIHTTRKRMIGVQRELKAAGKPYRSFEILNLGKYERQYFVGIDPSLAEKERLALSAQKEEHYVSLILFASLLSG